MRRGEVLPLMGGREVVTEGIVMMILLGVAVLREVVVEMSTSFSSPAAVRMMRGAP